MNSIELAAHLKLHPRAVILFGTLETRMKNQGTLESWQPHYAMNGCPVVEYNGANAREQPNSAEIEFMVREQGFPVPAALLSYSAKQGNLVQLKYGANGQAPTQGAYRVLREASALLKPIASSKREVLVVALPILTPDQYGIMSGRLHLLGVFGTDGTPLFLNPEAIGLALQSAYPANQQERSVAGASPAPAPAPPDDWYVRIERTLSVAGLKGNALHETVLKARGQELMDKGVVPTLEAGLALAQAEHAKSSPTPTPQATKDLSKERQALGSRMRGGSFKTIAENAPAAVKPARAPNRSRSR